uniref:KIB1-4 beta-propeller domain-containing protein n=1 Tax=Leersia perrieri TaxID=77586 RepID=A0A0D9X3T6_9ORYZ
MASSRCGGGWGDLPPDLLARIADALTIKPYLRARAVCSAWRAALPPASPSLLVRDLDNRHSAWCLSPRISTPLHKLMAAALSPQQSSCVVGSGGGGFVAVHASDWFGIVNPLSGKVVSFNSFPQLYVPRGEKLVVNKVVFAPNPMRAHFAAAAITGRGCVITYTAVGNAGWTDFQCPRLAGGIADVVYHEEHVYCLARTGDVHVLRLTAADDRLAAFEPLFDKDGTVFDATAAFAPPHDTIRECAGEKNLVVCNDNGDMYQIWRNDTCARIRTLPGGGKYRVENSQIFVFRYYPHRRPCWVAVEDLGGRSVFIGKNNAVALRVDGGGDASWLRGNCVYWIDTNHCPARAKVFDMVTRKSAQCFPGAADHSVICWCFLHEKQSSSSKGVFGCLDSLQPGSHDKAWLI